jgi:hypothetical protein
MALAPHIGDWQGSAAADWLEVIRQGSSVFLDAGSYSDGFAHFDRAMAYLDVSANGRQQPSVVIGLHGSGIAHALQPSVWEDWRLAATLQKAPEESRHNADTVSAWLRSAGTRYPRRTVILACDRTLARWTERARDAGSQLTLDDVKEALIPGIIRTTALVAAAAAAQHAGAAYFVSMP